ncbi:MAG: alcohol dehydrogenase catalytic domain-containing protein [Chloroflexota bacterium]
MSTMKAAIYTDLEKIVVQDVEKLAPPSGHVMIDTKCTGICGSDLHHYFGEWKASSSLAQGHETCGVVVQVADDVTGFQTGDKVVIECFSHCEVCVYCRSGEYNHCVERKWIHTGTHGGFAQYSTAHASGLFKIPDSMSFEEGALVEPLAVGHRALSQAKATAQDRVAIIGGGTIGLMCLAVAKAFGVRETLITVKYPQQAKLAKALGADHIVQVTETDIKEAVNDITDGIGMDVVIETVGGATNFNDTMSVVRKCGRVVLVAGYFEPLTVNLAPLVWSEAIITGSNCYGISGLQTDFQATIDLMTAGRIDPTPLVTHRYDFADVAEAFKVAADKQSGSVKVHLVQE